MRSEEVDEEFSARFSNDGKRYVYKIHNSRQRNPFLEKYSWYVPYVLDVEEMKKASKFFEGTHDFKGFMAVGGSQQTTVRTIRCCEVYQEGDERSMNFADAVQSQLISQLPCARAEANDGDYYILKESNLPAILVECGYLTNIEEETLLMTEDYQNKVAYAIMCGVVKYFGLCGND